MKERELDNFFFVIITKNIDRDEGHHYTLCGKIIALCVVTNLSRLAAADSTAWRDPQVLPFRLWPVLCSYVVLCTNS